MREEKRSEILQDALQYLDEDMIEEVNRIRGGVIEDERAVPYETSEFAEAILQDADRATGIKQHVSEIKQQSGERKPPEGGGNGQDIQSKKRMVFSWRRWAALAASVCVLVSGTWIWNAVFGTDKNMTDNSGMEHTDQDMNAESALENKSEFMEGDDAIGEQMNDINDAHSDKQGNGTDDVIDSNQDSIREEISGMPEMERPEDMAVVPELEGVRIPAMKVELKKEDTASDMALLFIHKGRCYVQDAEVREDDTFVGDYAGTSKGLIDEWTPQEGYVDGSGSISGDYYEVKGIDPGFMLCMRYPNGKVETYVHNNGITLNKGADLVDDRLHLRNNWKSVSFQTQDSYDAYDEDAILLAEENYAVLEEFLDALAEGGFTYLDGVTYSASGEERNNEHIYYHGY